MEGVSSVSTSEVSVRGKAVTMLYDEFFSFLETGQNVYFLSNELQEKNEREPCEGKNVYRYFNVFHGCSATLNVTKKKLVL